MKRALALIFVLAMTLSLLAGCGGNNSTVSNGSSQNTAGDSQRRIAASPTKEKH